jgi:hypothetical protein
MVDTACAPKEAARRRQVIYYALRDFLSQYELAGALQLWDTQFAQRSGFEAYRFVHQLCQQYGLEERSSEIRANVNQWLFRNFEELPSANSATPAVELPSPNNALVVFNFVVKQLLQKVSVKHSGWLANLQGFLASQPLNAEVSQPATFQLQEWSLNPLGFQFTHCFTPREMSHLVHLLYVWTCLGLGPVEADRNFTQVFREAERLPEALEFKPRSLL